MSARQKLIIKSKSDSQVLSPTTIEKSSTVNEQLYIHKISTSEASAGDRVWVHYSGFDESKNSIEVYLIRGDFKQPVLDINVKKQRIVFTIPILNVESAHDVQLCFFISDYNKFYIPFKYVPKMVRSSSNELSLFENLKEFANNGDPISLLYPFAAHISDYDFEENTVLHIAAKNSQSFALKLFLSTLKEEKKEKIINFQNKHGLTALHYAIQCGDPDAVHYLMNHGARIDISDSYGNTALHYLAEAYNESIFKEILEPSRHQTFNINQLNKEGYAPIHVAVRRLKLSLIEMLIEANATIDILDGKKKRNALIHAVEMNDFEIVQLLVAKGSDLNIEDTSNETALSIAAKNANYPMIGYLIDNGADINLKNGKGIRLSDSQDNVIQNILNGERLEIPKKEVLFAVPNDLATSRFPLFGRSQPDQKPNEEMERNRVVKRSRNELLHSAESMINETSLKNYKISSQLGDLHIAEETSAGPSTSSIVAIPSISSMENLNVLKKKFQQESICNLDYITRIRISKIFDYQSKWQELAKHLGCEHMVEFILICSQDDNSSPTMILLEQIEQLGNSTISNIREAMNNMGEEDGVKLIDGRFIY